MPTASARATPSPASAASAALRRSIAWTWRNPSLIHLLQQLFELVEPLAPEDAVERQPVGERREPARSGAVVRGSAFAPVLDQARLFQSLQMLGHRGLRDAGPLCERSHRELALAR